MAEDAILSLMTKQNKPFNAQSVTDWMAQHGYKKAQVQKALDSLAEAKRIIAKEFGKTKIYIPLQDSTNNPSVEENEAKKTQIAALSEQMKQEAALVKQLEQELSTWKTSLTEAELKARITTVGSDLTKMRDKLQALKGGAKLVKREDREKVEKTLSKYIDEWRKRKAMFKSAWAELSENLDGKQADLYEEMGVETDEALGVNLMELQNLLPKRRRC